MRIFLLVWIVAASAAISIGTSTVTMVILQNDLTGQVANGDSILAGSIVGTVIGIIGLVMIHVYLHNKTSKKIKTILLKGKSTDTDFNCDDDEIKRNYYLDHIAGIFSLVIKDLAILENCVRNYLENSVPKNWDNVRYVADRSRKQIAKFERDIILDFAQILDLVHNKSLIDINRTNNLHYSLYLCQEILRMYPGDDEHPIRELRNALRAEIAQLDEILLLLKEEMEN